MCEGGGVVEWNSGITREEIIIFLYIYITSSLVNIAYRGHNERVTSV